MNKLISYNLFENHYNYNKSYTNFINEASKIDSLMNKIGFSEKNAKFLDEKCGPLSIWMGNKIINNERLKYSEGLKNSDVLYFINTNSSIETLYGYKINYIMDWIKVGLNGSLGINKDLSLDELYKKSVQWHESLQIGEGDINYIENNPILIDYRDDKGIGFYWANLEVSYSEEESKRMGHCGNTGAKNTLFSLRKTTKLNDKYTLNKSILTASIGDSDGKLCQLKDAGNKKPDDKYHKYIVDLLLTDKVKQVGGDIEYRALNDFSLSDLNNSEIKYLYEKKPLLFNTYSSKLLLVKIEILPEESLHTYFEIKIDCDDISKYVNGGWNVSSYKDKNGNKKHIDIFEHILSGDMYLDYNSYDGDWEMGIKYYLNEENKNKIWALLKIKAKEENIDLEDDLEDSIKELDYDELISILRDVINDCEANSYYTYYYNKLKNCLEFYGNVIQLDDEGIKINADFYSITKNLDQGDIDLAIDNTSNYDDALYELIQNETIEKPNFSIDERWEPSIDEKDYNELLSEKLDELQKN